MLSNCIKNLLNLKGLNIKSVKNFKNFVEVYAELPISKQICPCCGTSTSKIHDHYTQPIKDIPVQFKPTTIFLKKNGSISIVGVENFTFSINIPVGIVFLLNKAIAPVLLPYLSNSKYMELPSIIS